MIQDVPPLKCEVCGQSAESTLTIARLCHECRALYRVFHCSSCGVRVLRPVSLPEENICHSCALLPLLEKVPPSELERLREEWRSGNRLQAIQSLREMLHIGINDAVDMLNQPEHF